MEGVTVSGCRILKYAILLSMLCVPLGCEKSEAPSAAGQTQPAVEKSQTVAELADEAERKFMAAQLDESLAAINKALALDPDSEIPLLWRARVYIALRKHEEAIEDLSQILTSNPKSVDARWERAKAYYENGDYIDAEYDLSVSVQTEQGVSAYRAYSLVDLCLDRWHRSIASLMLLTEVRGNAEIPVTSHVLLAYVYAGAMDSRVRDGKLAMDHAETARLLSERNTSIVCSALAMANAELGNFEEAVAWQEKAKTMAHEIELNQVEEWLALYKSGRPIRAPGRELAQGFGF